MDNERQRIQTQIKTNEERMYEIMRLRIEYLNIAEKSKFLESLMDEYQQLDTETWVLKKNLELKCYPNPTL